MRFINRNFALAPSCHNAHIFRTRPIHEETMPATNPSDSVATIEDNQSVLPDAIAAPFALTDRAASRILEILQNEAPGTLFRVGVNGGGCSGFQYDFSFCTQEEADDLRVTNGQAAILVDNVSVDLLRGSVLDYVEELLGAHFKIANPNAKSTCGCGTSFSL